MLDKKLIGIIGISMLVSLIALASSFQGVSITYESTGASGNPFDQDLNSTDSYQGDIITANAFYGDGGNLTNISGGGPETDPIFTSHIAYTLQSGWMANWNTSYTWANSLYNTIGLKDLTSGEVDQLENIGTKTISASQWGYLGDMDQGVSTDDDVEFNSVNISGDALIYWAGVDNNLTVNSSGNITFIVGDDVGYVIESDGIWSSKHQSGARVRLESGQAIPSFMWTRLNLFIEDFDNNNDFSGFRFNVPKTGIYQISYSVKLESYAGTGTFIGAIWVNGSIWGGYETCHDIAEVSGNSANSGCDILKLNKNDFVELYVWHNYAIGARVCPAVLYSNYLAIQKIA